MNLGRLNRLMLEDIEEGLTTEDVEVRNVEGVVALEGVVNWEGVFEDFVMWWVIEGVLEVVTASLLIPVGRINYGKLVTYYTIKPVYNAIGWETHCVILYMLDCSLVIIMPCRSVIIKYSIIINTYYRKSYHGDHIHYGLLV